MRAPPSGVSQADETVVHERRLEVRDVVVNTCTGESVALWGDVHIKVADQAGAHDGHVNGHLTGTGSAGNAYILNMQARTALAPDGETFDVVTRQLLVSQGSAPNLLTTVTVTSEPFAMTVEADCRG